MARELTAYDLISACDDNSVDAGISIKTDLQPIAGDGTPVKPATYAGGKFQTGRRWIQNGSERVIADILVIDNEPSQANRLEAALKSHRDDLGLPDIVLDLGNDVKLPAHLPAQISIFDFPHRNADAYLRDSMIDGVSFNKTDIGKRIFDSTGNNADALLEWCPQALLFGFWQSHLGKNASQAKRARSWTSEIVGVDPAAESVYRLGLKGDPLNLNADEDVEIADELDEASWKFSSSKKSESNTENSGSKSKKLSKVGHGQVPVGSSDVLAGVSFREIFQQATLSFASLRTIRRDSASAEARALLAALGLAAHIAAFGHAFTLRSGADLRPRSTRWTWLGESSDEDLVVPSFEKARSIFSECVNRAIQAGLPVGDWTRNRLMVAPSASLVEAIKKSWPVA